MRTIDANQLKQTMDKADSPTVINVLPREQFEKQHIPGSSSIPLDTPDFEKKVEQAAGGKDQPVVVYCANTQCDMSDRAAKRLDRAGFRDVADFEGGMKAWEDAGMNVEAAA